MAERPSMTVAVMLTVCWFSLFCPPFSQTASGQQAVGGGDAAKTAQPAGDAREQAATPGAADADKDGFTDADEALAGTDPKVADSAAVFDWAEAVAKLRRIGAALERYEAAHKDAARALPPDLATLVKEGLLDRQMLTCHCDPFHGEQGGIPDSYATQRVVKPESEEIGTSFFYEFSSRPCTLPGTAASQVKNADWYTVKVRQFEMGNVVGARDRQPYPKSLFPVARCFWLDYPRYAKRTGYGTVPMTVLNLAWDFRTVYASSDAWEEGAARALASKTPVLRDLGTAPLQVRLGEAVSFPLWADGVDVGAGTFRGQAAVGAAAVGSLVGCMYTFTPAPESPAAFVLAVEFLQDGKTPVLKEYSLRWTAATP